jgi:hypothetical protein
MHGINISSFTYFCKDVSILMIMQSVLLGKVTICLTCGHVLPAVHFHLEGISR